jgi:hypothetical protein
MSSKGCAAPGNTGKAMCDVDEVCPQRASKYQALDSIYCIVEHEKRGIYSSAQR